MKLLKRENLEFIQDGEYGLFEGTADFKPTEKQVKDFIIKHDYKPGLLVNIRFDNFQKIWRYNGTLAKL